MRKKIILYPLIVLYLIAVLTARPYHGLNSGIAWDIGGIEFKPRIGIFLCENDYNPETGRHWHNPLADVFPSLVADC